MIAIDDKGHAQWLTECNCFRNGPFGVKPPNDHLAAGIMLPSVVGLKPPHHAIRWNLRADLNGVLPV